MKSYAISRKSRHIEKVGLPKDATMCYIESYIAVITAILLFENEMWNRVCREIVLVLLSDLGVLCGDPFSKKNSWETGTAFRQWSLCSKGQIWHKSIVYSDYSFTLHCNGFFLKITEQSQNTPTTSMFTRFRLFHPVMEQRGTVETPFAWKNAGTVGTRRTVGTTGTFGTRGTPGTLGTATGVIWNGWPITRWF